MQGCPPHGPEACLGRVGQDAQPRSCRVRRTAHTSKRRTPLQAAPSRAPSFFRACQPRDERIRKRSPRCARESSVARLYPGRHAARVCSSFDVPWLTHTRSVEGRPGWVGGVSAAWMPRPSPQGWVHGVPANPSGPTKTGIPLWRPAARGLRPLAGQPLAEATSAGPAPQPAHPPAARSARMGSCRHPARTPAKPRAGTGVSGRSAHEAAC